MKEIDTFVTHLECSYTGKTYPADQLHGLSEAGKPLLVRYDLEALGKAIEKEDLEGRLPEFWRYREFLPVRKSENIVRLG
ncbi:MAG TPA: threonine synthase, partial [Gammaproteobacteria bacterium]|nr:threonine synthase [Gammaproteobacteria bacterium]